MQPARRSNEQRREHSIQQVLSAALRLFVSRGYENATIDLIAAEAGLTKGAVYFYFKGKSALLHALLDAAEELYADIFARLQASGADPVEQLEMFVDWCAETGAENQELLGPAYSCLVAGNGKGRQYRGASGAHVCPLPQ